MGGWVVGWGSLLTRHALGSWGAVMPTLLGSWTDMIARLFLTPFGLGSSRSSVTHSGTWGSVDQRVTRQAPIPFYAAGEQSR